MQGYRDLAEEDQKDLVKDLTGKGGGAATSVAGGEEAGQGKVNVRFSNTLCLALCY